MKSTPSLSEKFAALSNREKYLALGSGVFLIVFVSYMYFIEPAIEQWSMYGKKMRSLEIETTSLSKQQTIYQEAALADANAKIKQEIAALEEKKQALNSAFSKELAELVSPDEMAVLMEQVFSHATRLTLVEMASHSPTNLFQEEKNIKEVNLFQHSITLSFTGTFFDVQAFMKELESNAAQLYWHSVDYQVLEYPTAKVILNVYTLSTEKAFIGVK